MKKLLFSILALLLIFNFGCKPKKEYKYFSETGPTQGTTFRITYKYYKRLRPQIDSILKVIDNSLSTFNPNSILSKVNRNEPVELDQHFINVFKKAKEISEATGGAFDVTIGPLVEAYGFGSGERLKNLTQEQIDSILQFVGYHKVHLEGNRIVKEDPRIKLDFNAIAQGYTVDVIAKFFDSIGVRDYLIEIGGEVLVRGFNPSGEKWRIGVDKPIEGSNELNREIQLIVGLGPKKQAISTSGNYRKFYVENGIKFTHTINPKTGQPVRDTLLSVTIIAPNCTDADGYATACMVVGMQKAYKLVQDNPNLEALFIYADRQGRYRTVMTPGFKKYVIE